ncbi:mercuric transporter MerT family protein [Paremcibacter congregatus]|uniref:mercuric transporter MerT family protein n=1 Tax=Paremcibacter congregatus TaxID=2043170 RepID=UPI0030ED3174|tara:strand:- start:9000 stop:9446 length:447 start_codon:yes stop_codon:yes gene_type:complete
MAEKSRETIFELNRMKKITQEIIPLSSEVTQSTDETKKRLVAAGSVIGALLASSCCIVPLLLLTLGVSGAWIGNLTMLEPYKPYFIAVTLVLLGLGFWQVYFKPKKACDEGSYCAHPTSGRIVKAALWLATGLVLLAATIDFWAPFFY